MQHPRSVPLLAGFGSAAEHPRPGRSGRAGPAAGARDRRIRLLPPREQAGGPRCGAQPTPAGADPLLLRCICMIAAVPTARTMVSSDELHHGCPEQAFLTLSAYAHQSVSQVVYTRRQSSGDHSSRFSHRLHPRRRSSELVAGGHRANRGAPPSSVPVPSVVSNPSCHVCVWYWYL